MAQGTGRAPGRRKPVCWLLWHCADGERVWRISCESGRRRRDMEPVKPLEGGCSYPRLTFRCGWIGHEILTKPDIAAAIEKAKAERAERTRLTGDTSLPRIRFLR